MVPKDNPKPVETNGPLVLSFREIILRHVLYDFSEGAWWDRATLVHSNNQINGITVIVFPPSLGSPPKLTTCSHVLLSSSVSGWDPN